MGLIVRLGDCERGSGREHGRGWGARLVNPAGAAELRQGHAVTNGAAVPTGRYVGGSVSG